MKDQKNSYKELAKIPSFIEELEGPEWSENEKVNREDSRAMYKTFMDETCTSLSERYLILSNFIVLQGLEDQE